MTKNGQAGILFTRKLLKEFEYNSIVQRYNDFKKCTKTKERETKSETLYLELLFEMELLALISIKEKLNPNA